MNAPEKRLVLALRYMSEVLKVHELPDRSQAFATLTEMLGQTPAQVTQLLWDKYDPSWVWTPFAIAGIIAAIGHVSPSSTLPGGGRM